MELLFTEKEKIIEGSIIETFRICSDIWILSAFQISTWRPRESSLERMYFYKSHQQIGGI